MSVRGFAAALVIAASAGVAACYARAASPNARDDRCARLASTGYPGLEVVSATKAPAGRFSATADAGWPIPASCRVVAVARTVSNSEIGFELWLPDGWNGRYAQLGNGGFAGNIDQPSLANEIRRGNAAAMTDTGHKASQFDASWALGHPAKIIDYGYRSIKVTSDAARALIARYYGRPARQHYFVGCSNGGRQALMAAQRYPNDWDGIIAGSPAVEWTKQLATFAAIQHRLRSSPANWIPAARIPLIQKAAQASCSKDFGVGCRVDPHQLLCAGSPSPNCLTAEQAATLDVIQSGPKDSRGRPLFHGFDPISATLPGNWESWIVNPDRDAPSELAFATQAYRYLILDRPGWRVEDFNQDRDFELASNRIVGGQPLASILDAGNVDLSRFVRRGGKMIIYVGRLDAVILPAAALEYYGDLTQRLGGVGRAQRNIRLFVIPQMQHCQDGLGPSAFGQAWVAPAARADPRHDIRLAIEDWLERGRAPSSLVAAQYAGEGSQRTIVRTQEIRPYSPSLSRS